jgi:hypothetical protein
MKLMSMRWESYAARTRRWENTLFAEYLTNLFRIETIECRIMELMNDELERIWKETIVT